MNYFYNTIGLFLFCGIAFLFSENRKKIPWKMIFVTFFFQFILLIVLYKIPASVSVFNQLNLFAQELLNASRTGAAFVFGDVMNQQKPAFFISLISNLIFFSVLISLLYRFKIIPWLVLKLSKLTKKFLKLDSTEAIAAISNIFIGMAEANLLLKNYLENMSRAALMLLLSMGFATISGTLLLVYSSFGMQLTDLLLATIISIPATVIYSRILVPQTEPISSTENTNKNLDVNFMEDDSIFLTIVNGATRGLKLAFNICALMLVIISLIALGNIILGKFGALFSMQISLENILGKLGYPLALLLGIPQNEAGEIGELLSKKVVFNEFIAYMQLSNLKEVLSPRTFTIATFALCSFSNFGSVAIQMASLNTLAPSRKKEVSQLIFKALLAGLLASFSTAILISMII